MSARLPAAIAGTAEPPAPTGEVRALVELLGAEAALVLIERHGGTRYYVPHRPTPRLVALVGLAAARALSRGRGGQVLKVPVARTWRIALYRQRGCSYAEIARRAGCDESTVWRVLSAAELTARQYDLFEPR